MTRQRELDCIVVGYNEVPFGPYEAMLRTCGEESEAYRDLNMSFVDVAGEPRPYMDLMNYVTHLAKGNGGANGYPETFKSGDAPNLAAAYLTNFLNRRGHRTRFVNLFQPEKERLAKMLEERPLLVAITTTLYVLNVPVIAMVEFIRRHAPEVKIVVGGPLIANHARNYAGEDLETALNEIGADVYVVESQGELTLSKIADCLKSGGELHQVPNILYRDGTRLRKTATQPENNSLNENYVDWEVLGRDAGHLGATIQLRTARSCAFSCAFCNFPVRAGRLALADLDVVARELESIRRLGYVKNVIFIDDTFNVPITRFKQLCHMMIEKDYPFDWFSYFRCGNSDAEAVELAARSGCKGVFLGIESGSPTILENMNKRATLEKYAEGIKQLRENGIMTFGSFITGFPGETRETVEQTDEFIEKAGLDYYRTQLWYNEPGTPIRQQSDRFGITGDGFVWTHDTMNSMEAMEEVEGSFLDIAGPVWLPQWSYDFWAIPYLLGQGIAPEDLRDFLRQAQKLLELKLDPVPEPEKERIESTALARMTGVAAKWSANV